MSFEGVWQLEVLGPYGWQEIGTAFLRNGQYLAAGGDYHALGSYQEDGDKFIADVKSTQHGKVPTVFGETKKHVKARIEGEMKEPDKITGTLYPPKNRNYDLKLRMTRAEKLD